MCMYIPTVVEAGRHPSPGCLLASTTVVILLQFTIVLQFANINSKALFRDVATSLAGPVLAGPLFLKAKIKLHFTKSK